MTQLLESLATYVPDLILERLKTDPASISAPISREFQAVVLYADISGFTALTEQLAERGPVGAEDLSRVLNAYFGRLIDLFSANGGDIVKFAGDALLVVWPLGLEVSREALIQAVCQAASCALEAQQLMKNYQTEDGHRLYLKIGIGVGPLASIYLGGVFRRWEFILAGGPLEQVGLAESQSRAGEVILSPEAAALVLEFAVGETLPTGALRMTSLATGWQRLFDPAPLQIPGIEAELALRSCIPRAVVDRLVAGQYGWLAELRRVTVLFVNLPDLTYGVPLALAQQAMEAMQRTLYYYEGSVNKISIDDKGSTLVAAFGLPPFAHEDDALRGVLAGMALYKEMEKLSLRCTIGVTTGRVFCGAIGNDRRREYTMIGGVVNLAARLMKAVPVVSSQGQALPVLCDEPTYRASRDRVDFEILAPVLVKGRTEKIEIFRPSQARQVDTRSESAIVGRKNETTFLTERLLDFSQGQQVALVIQGEAGIGKTKLVEHLLQQAKSVQVRLLVGAGDAIEKTNPYHAWRSVFWQLFGLEEISAQRESGLHVATALLDEKERGVVLDLLYRWLPELTDLAPLLNAVLPMNLPENELTVQMTGEIRADNTNRLLSGLIRKYAGDGKTLLILEDAHWMDSASWLLARQAMQDTPSLMLVIVTRPMTEFVPQPFQQILQRSFTHTLLVEAMPESEAEAMIAMRLGVERLDPAVLAFIQNQAEGHPFFCIELALALRDAGMLAYQKGMATLAPGLSDLHALDFPTTIEGVITSRIDRLTPQQQLTLKVASVIGRVFAYKVLQDVYPIEIDRPWLRDHLNNMTHLELTALETPEPELAYVFKHMITREVAYNLMAFAQRRQLHQRLASWYEIHYQENLSQFFPILAYHWSQTDEHEKTLEYLEKAGDQALLTFASHEAVNFYQEALRHASMRPTTHVAQNGPSQLSQSLRMARWYVQLSKAYQNLGLMRETRENALQALVVLGVKMPKTRPALVFAILGELFKQGFSRLNPARLGRPVVSEQEERLQTLAQVYARLIYTYFFDNDVLNLVYTDLAMLNTAQQLAPTPELVEAFAFISAILGLAKLHPLAESSLVEARRVAEAQKQISLTTRVAIVASVYRIGLGQWEQVKNSLNPALQDAERLGDKPQWAEATVILAFTAFLEGQFETCEALYSHLAARSLEWDMQQQIIWARAAQALLAIHQANPQAAVDYCEDGLARLQSNSDRISEINMYAHLASARFNLGQYPVALQAAAEAMQRIVVAPPVVYSTCNAYLELATVYFGLWEQARRAGQTASEHKAQAGQLLRQMEIFKNNFPIGAPQYFRAKGVYLWLLGKPGPAKAQWEKSLATARKLRMPFQEALTLLDIARFRQAPDPALFEPAAAIFQSLGCHHELGLIARCLENTGH